MLPQYEILSMLGRGGMGAVYKGVQQTLDRPVAIKILSTALEESEMGFAERFKNEARALGRLSHPGIVGVYDFGSAANGLLYIVMEFVDGTDVSKMLAKKGRLPVDHAMAITAHVCDALAYAHERGIIHRDIKPANIMVGYDGVVRVADFGLAKMSHDGQSGLTQSGMAMGTLHYMAPEALMLGSSVDHRADIYAVGVMLYQMLAGKLPQGLFEMPSKLVPGIDPRYDGIISKAMREDREARYQTILALRADLDHILTQPVIKVEAAAEHAPAALPTQARPQRTIPQRQPVPEPELAPPPRRSSSNTLVWAAVAVLACVAGWLVMQRGRTPQTPGNTTSAGQMAETPATATAANPPPTPSPNSTRPTTGVWINGLEAWWNGHGKNNDAFGRENDTQTWVKTDYALLHPLPGNAPQLKDQAVRARARLPDGKGLFTVLLRMSKTADGSKLKDGYTAELNGPGGQVRLGFRRDGKYTGIQNFTLASGFDFTQPHTLELQIISGILKVSLDGSILGTPTNAEITEGHPAVYGSAGTLIESFEFVNLDEAVAPSTAQPSGMASGGPQSTQPTAIASAPKGESSSQWTIAFSKETHRSKAAVPAGRSVSDQFHWVESNETFGNLTWEFADARLGTAGLEIAQATLRFKTPDLNLATTKDPVTVTHAGKVIGSIKGATRNAWNEIHLDPKQIPTTGQPFELTLNCGNDAVIVFGQKSSSPAHLVVTHAITRSPLIKSSPEPSNPELLALEQQYRAALEKQVTPVVTEYAKTILASYRNALDRAARTPGVASTDATALRAETQRLATDPSVPDTDPPGTPQSLITLRQTYRQAVAAFRSEKEAPLKTIYDKQVREVKIAELAGATKDKPFTNSLGMKFVRLPQTNTLMCIHETRRRDYARFAAETPGLDKTWENPRAYNGLSLPVDDDTHPASAISHDDAVDFCQWLSNHENRSYRLPTDREWSIAVGIGDLEDGNASPTDLNSRVLDNYPWGSYWPPVNGDGNYGDKSWLARDPKATNCIESLDDKYLTTSPVMSFKPNTLGLFDLGGNCSELLNEVLSSNRAVIRGESWLPAPQRNRLSSYRGFTDAIPKGFRPASIGFRCVVLIDDLLIEQPSGAKPPATPASTALPTTPTPPAPPPATPVPAPPAADPDTLYRWTNQSGRVIRGAFIGLDNAGVKLRVDGNMVSVPLADLSVESRQQAQRLAAGTPVSSSALPDTVPTTGWQPVITDLFGWLQDRPNVKRSGLWIDLPFGTSAAIAGTPDAAVKVRIQKMEGDHPYLLLRAAESLSTKSGSIELGWSNLDDFTRVTLGPRLTVSGTHETSRPLALGTEHELVLMAAGSQVAAFLDGKKIIEAATSVTNASSHFLGIRGGNKGLRIKDLEWMPLAQAKASAATPVPAAASPVRRVGVDRFDSARFSSGLVMLESNLKSQIMPAADNSHTPLLLQDLYTASVELEIEQCQKTTAHAADLSWFEAERERVRSKSYPNGSNDPAQPDCLQKMRAAYWQAALEIDRRLDASKK
jgi:serine/threonine protein kinase